MATDASVSFARADAALLQEAALLSMIEPMTMMRWATALLLVACSGGSETSSPADGGAASSSGASSGATPSSSSGGTVSDGGGTTDAGAGTTAGQASGASLIVTFVLNINSSGDTSNTYVQASVGDASGKPLQDAKVTMTPAGGDPLDIPWGVSSYQNGFQIGWKPSYEVSVTHSTGSRTGIVITPPSDFTIKFDPPFKVDTATTLTWTPNNEPNVVMTALVDAFSTGSGNLLPDTGTLVIPATGFPAKNTKAGATVTRERTAKVDNVVSTAVAVVVRYGPVDVQP